NTEGAITQRQSVARVNHVGCAVTGGIGSAYNRVASGGDVASCDRAEQAMESFIGIDVVRPRQDRRMARDVNEHVVVQYNVSLEQMPPARRIIVQVKDDVWLPTADELVNRDRFAAEQELMVPVEIDSVGVAAGASRATVRIGFRNDGQLNGRKSCS